MLQERLTGRDVPQAPRDDGAGNEVGHAGRPLQLEWYANWFEVGHNALQFKIDCARTTMSDAEEPTMYIRVTSDALRARQLFRLLGAELIEFMDVHGPIVSDSERGDAP